MALLFPIDCISPRQKVEYCFRAREILRLIHNKVGEWYSLSKSEVVFIQSQYDDCFPLPECDGLRKRYPYTPKLSKEQWDDFQENYYDVIDREINTHLSENVQAMMDASEWTPDIEAIHGGL